MRVAVFLTLVLTVAGGCASVQPDTTRAAATPDTASSDGILALTGRIIDGTGADPFDGVVLVRGGLIECVGTAAACPVPAGAEVIDAGSGTVLPGFIDLHVHGRPQYISWFPAAGVTTVRDASNDFATVAAFAEVGPYRPRVVAAGPVIDGERAFFRRLFASFGIPDSTVAALVRSPLDGPIDRVAALVVTTPEEARAAVDSVAAHGAGVVKLYEQLSPEAFAAAARRAREIGLPTMADLGVIGTRGLSGAEVDLVQAAALGVGSVEHSSGAALAYQRLGGDPLADPLDEALIDTLAAALVRSGTALVPTMMVTRYNAADAVPDLSAEGVPMSGAAGPAAASLHAQWDRVHGEPGKDRTSAQADHRFALALTRRVHALGGLVGAGSDTPAGAYNTPGGALHQEMEELVEAGLTPLQAVHAATGAAAVILNRPDLGVIAPGRVADLLVVGGDPARDVRATRGVRVVVLGGEPVAVETLRAQALAEAERLLGPARE